MIFSIVVGAIILYVTYKLYLKHICSPPKYVNVEGKAVLITGCDTGFGNELAVRLDNLGFNVIASCFDPKCEGAKTLVKLCSKRLTVIGLDVSRDECVADAKTEAINKLKNSKAELWAVVNNAGIDYVADIELCSMDVFYKLAEVNLFGMIRVTKAFLPLLRKTKGRVINVTSVKGRVCLPYISAYGITKYGGESFSDTLRMEMKKFGVKVVVIEPGNFGSLTAIVKGRNVSNILGLGTLVLDRIKKDFERTWSEATQDIKDTYGEDYMFAHVNRLEGNEGEGSNHNVTPVIDAFVDAIMNENPKTRYLIDGSPDWIDRYCFYARLYPYLPSALMDYLLLRWFTKGMPSVKTLS